MPASEAISSRRRPGTRRCPLAWIPTSSGRSRARRTRRNSRSSAFLVIPRRVCLAGDRLWVGCRVLGSADPFSRRSPQRLMTAMNITLSHDHIAIRVVDYAGTLRWYTDKLDFHVDVEWPYGDMQLAYLSNGTAKVEVLGGATAEAQPDPISLEPTFQHEGLNHFCLAIEDLDGTLAELRARGVEFVGEPFVVERSEEHTSELQSQSNI